MKQSKLFWAIIVAAGMFVFCENTNAQEQRELWTGTLRDGTVIDEKDLKKMLFNHKKWLDSDGAEGEKANLQRAYLQGANLQKVDLREAFLQHANLREANLFGASLYKADFQEADLREANLQWTNLREANLQWTNLRGADLKHAVLDRANLQWTSSDKAIFNEASLESANLQGAKLRYASLQKADLRFANLQNANLQNAFLERVWLMDADLKNAYLKNADLNNASLDRADFKNANLKQANLQWADLWKAVLQEAKVQEANFQNANLKKANLQKANLSFADLQNADLQRSGFQNAILHYAKLQKADLRLADLKDAYLQGANFQNANLQQADLQGAFLFKADLQGAILYETNLKKANFKQANLGRSIFETTPNKLPIIPSIAEARNLSSIKFLQSPHALVELRNAFKIYGLRKQEREITYAIKHSGYEIALKKGNLLTKIEVILGWLFFEKTCQWGMSPERPFFILAGLILFFTIPYTQAISQDIYGKQKTDGIWKVWNPERMRDDFGKYKPKELLESIHPWFCFKNGFYFSILSAFNIGWRELNVGNWITRMQRYEYRFYASGWARTVSGIQSIISVYLLALSVLTYFGRPFESY